MASSSKLDYLKRYMSSNKDPLKKKKRKPNPHSSGGIVVIDSAVEVHKLASRIREDDPYRDNGPTIAEIIDDTIPAGMQDSSKWRSINKNPVNAPDSDDDNPPVQIKQESPDRDFAPVRNSHRRRTSDDDLDVPRNSSRRAAAASNRPSVDEERKRPSSGDDLPPVRVASRPGNVSGSSRSRARDFPDLSPVLDRCSRRDRGTTKGRSPVDSDQSPPRVRSEDAREKSGGKRHLKTPTLSAARSSNVRNSRRADSSDSSPVRNNTSVKRRPSRSPGSDLPPLRSDQPSTSRGGDQLPKKTLSGMSAGLQNARTLREEADKKRKAEDEMFKKMDAEISGRGAGTVYRDRKTGKKRDMEAEKKEEAEKAKRQKEHDEKYRKWGKGLAQQDKQQQAVEDAIHEMSKPLARYVDDSDRDDLLKAQDREGDPMLEYLSKKKKTGSADSVAAARPKYKGPQPPPNRFNVQPGYRWDGVDRSNGFEKERFKRQSNRSAMSEEAYKWSTEDM